MNSAEELTTNYLICRQFGDYVRDDHPVNRQILMGSAIGGRVMKGRSLPAINAAMLASLSLLVIVEAQSSSGNAAAQGAAALKTAWGEPKLEGLWTDELRTPLQRNAKYGGREFLTDAEFAELNAQRSKAKGRDFRPPKGSEADVA